MGELERYSNFRRKNKGAVGVAFMALDIFRGASRNDNKRDGFDLVGNGIVFFGWAGSWCEIGVTEQKLLF